MQTVEGVVKSVSNKNSIIVLVDHVFHHPKYKKTIRRTTRISAHSKIEGIKVGDKVSLVKSRPYSKTKHYKTVEKK